ncbi:hypothetical protein OG453_07735 [Streptomyces sp. NBC_01381]|uniref:hypothetical protein n=1 Tax=Streptomyces sp. NBC_01381 TaxID=2903845 RepID=UPI002250BD26|nr:hypothetical protein [Streptomyces sp. NBC_01381]MCX4666561.1 hypothetical protein [Streptomyces sp. NBC_01381]
MNSIHDLRIDETATYGTESYAYDRAGNLVASSMNAVDGCKVRGDVKALLVMAYDTVTQHGDRIELTGGRQHADGGPTLLRAFTKIDR